MEHGDDLFVEHCGQQFYNSDGKVYIMCRPGGSVCFFDPENSIQHISVVAELGAELKSLEDIKLD